MSTENEDQDLYDLTIQVVDGSYHDTITIRGTLEELTNHRSGAQFDIYPGSTEEEYVKVRRSLVVSERLERALKKPSPLDVLDKEEKQDDATKA